MNNNKFTTNGQHSTREELDLLLLALFLFIYFWGRGKKETLDSLESLKGKVGNTKQEGSTCTIHRAKQVFNKILYIYHINLHLKTVLFFKTQSSIPFEQYIHQANL